MAIPAGCESASIAAKDVFPATIFTNPTVPWIRLSLAALVVEVVVVTAALQSLPELCQLLLGRASIRGEVVADKAFCPDDYASGSASLQLSLVVISAVAILPFCSAAIAEFCVTATPVVLLAACV